MQLKLLTGAHQTKTPEKRKLICPVGLGKADNQGRRFYNGGTRVPAIVLLHCEKCVLIIVMKLGVAVHADY